MCDTGARAVDHVLSDIRLRQWVLLVPFELRRVRTRSQAGFASGLVSHAAVPIARQGPIRLERPELLTKGRDEIGCHRKGDPIVIREGRQRGVQIG